MHCNITKNFLSAQEGKWARSWMTTLYQTGWFHQFPDDPTRFARNGMDMEVLPAMLSDIKNKVMTVFNLHQYEDPDPRRYVFLSYHLEGGAVHKHRHFPPEGIVEMRCNIIISDPTSGGDPVICDTTYYVGESDLWVFNSNDQHWTTPVVGDKPRMMCSFGFMVPASFHAKMKSTKCISV